MKRVFITGACGYIGRQLAKHLHDTAQFEVVGVDIHLPSEPTPYALEKMDIRDAALSDILAKYQITHAVHLASIVNPGQDEALEYDIDVNGTANVLKACADNNVEHISITSSGAAYGYYPDNPEWLTEQHPLRGNDSFSYSRHKRLVEEMLAKFAAHNPNINMLILRPCTVLGANTQNRITSLFDRSKMLAVGDADSPFVFIWDQDVVSALAHGITQDKAGAYNLAGDGKLTVDELANLMGKSVQRMPAWLLKCALWLGKNLGLSQAGPDQLLFLQYRPVLLNTALKDEFGYQPAKTSQEVFTYFWQHRQKR